MARVQVSETGVVLWASEADTYEWAQRWPCSGLIGHRFVATFDADGLCDLTVDGRYGDQDFDGHAFSACCADLIAESGKLDEEHPCYFLAVGQHLAKGAPS